MSNNIDLKKAISQRIQAFASQRLRQSALALFAAIGYTSDRTVETRSVQEFREQRRKTASSPGGPSSV